MSSDLNDIWKVILGELELSMTTATFDTWLKDSRLLSMDEGAFVVGVRNQYAVDWLENRMKPVVVRVVEGVLGKAIVSIRFEQKPTEQPKPLVLQSEVVAVAPVFPGFEPYRSNHVQAPRQYFEIVVPAGPPVVVAFVAAVMANTIGVVVNFHTNERREWWEATHREIMAGCGIRSVNSVRKAVRLSRELGYVLVGLGRVGSRYRLRRFGEPVDNPVDKSGDNPVDKSSGRGGSKNDPPTDRIKK